MNSSLDIPKLQLNTCETGGGWGLGDQYARLPPADEQTKSNVCVYKVAKDASREPPSSEEEDDSASSGSSSGSSQRTFREVPQRGDDDYISEDEDRAGVPETDYFMIPEDDDNTFVDHGSTSNHEAPLLEHKPSSSPAYEGPKAESLTGVRQRWQPPRLVSRLSMNQNIRDMQVSPDGTTLWAAIGDDPLAAFELDGTDLHATRALDSVTQVYCMAVVKLPRTKQTTFKSTALEKARRAKKKTNHQNNSAKSPVVGDKKDDDDENEYTLWCGLNKGNISIIDLQSGAEDGFIRGAHSQTLNKIWYLENGTVWTAGRDKAVRVWDPQTRRKVKNRNIAAILSDMCYVRSLNLVWAVSDDNIIRVFEAGGDNVRVSKQSHDKAENAIKMKSEISLVQYDEGSNLVWVGMAKVTAVMNPTTYEALTNLPLTLTSLTFHKKTAIITGHGTMLGVEGTSSRIALLDVTNPLEPSLLYIGGTMLESINPIGVRLFTSVPLAVVAHDEGRLKHKKLSVFTYEEVEPFGRTAFMPLDSPSRSTRKRSGESRHSKPSNNGGSISPKARGPTVTTEAIADSGMPSPSSVALSAIRLDQQRPTTGLLHMNNPELLSSITQLDRRTDELTSVLTNLRRSELPMADFTKIHNSLTQWLLSSPDNLLPLDPSEQEAIERDLQTPEGKAVGVAIARLRKTATSSSLPFKEHVSRSPPQSMMATRPPVDGSQYNERRETSAGVSDFFTPDSMQNHNMTYSELNCMSETILGGGVNSAGSGLTNVDTTLQWVSQVSQNMQTERQSFQRQLQGLQKHNKRYVERNVAFSNGLSGMDKALRVHAQRLLGEVSHYLSTLSGGEQSALESATAATRHHLAQLQESLQRAVPITPSSNPRAIAEAFDQMDSILSNMMATQQSISALSARSFTTIRRDSVLSERSTLSEFRSLPTQNTVLYRETQPGPDINGGNLRSGDTSLGATVNAMKSPPPSGYLGDETGPTGLLSEDRLASIASPDQAEIGQLPTVSASRLVEMVTDEVSQSERHVLDLKAAWNHIEGMRKVSYLPYREQQKPDLRKDFMQFVVLWDLMQAHELIDFAREECNFCMMEVVLKANDNGCFGGQFPFAAVYKSAAEKGRVQEEVNKEATRVVNLSIDLEVSVKRIRRTFERQQSAISADLKTNPAVKGFVAMNPSPSVNERLMQGVLYWCHVCLHLLCECFECVEELICPREESSAYINKDNFLLIQNRLADWGNIVEEIERLVSQCRAGLQYIHHAASQTRQRANSTKPEDQNAADEDGEEEEEAQESESYSFFRFEGNGLRPIVFSIYAQYIVATKSFPKILDTPKNRSSSPRVSTVGAGLDGGEGHYSTLADSEALLAEVIAEMDTVLKKCSVLDTYCGILQRHVETILGSQRRGISEEDGKGEDVFVSVSQDNDTNNNSNTSAPPEGTTNNGSLTGSKEGGTELTSSMPNTANHSSNGGAISEAEARKMLELFANEPNDTRRASISDSNMRIQYGEESYLHPHQLLNAALKESCKMTQADPPPASEEGDGRSASNGASFLGGSLNRKGSAVDLMSPLKIKSASPMTHTSTTSSSPTATERSGSNATKKTPQLGLLNTRRSFS